MFLIRKLLYLIFCKVLFRVKFVNKNLEKNVDKCVVCANHLSFADPAILYSDISKLAVMAKAELFANKIIAKIFHLFGIFPIHRGEKDARSIVHSIKVFKETKYKKLLIFPEGTRVKYGEKVRPRVGAVYVAMKAGVPILPVRIEKKHPKRAVFTSVKVIYDNPIYLDNSKVKDKLYLQEVSDKLMETIYNLKDNNDDKNSKNGKITENKKMKKVKIKFEE